MSESGKKLTLAYILIPLLVVALAVIFVLRGRRVDAPMAMPPQAVVLGVVSVTEITDSAEYVALMEADSRVDLLARVSGFLVSKNFTDGDWVKAGQLLFQIEPDQYRAVLDNAEADVLSAQARLDRATLDFNRITDLYHKKTSPKSDYDSSKADYEVAVAALKSAQAGRTRARLDLDYASIKAPFDGWVSDTPYSVGSLLGPDSGVLATVVSVDPILVTFGISDKIFTKTLNDEFGRRDPLREWQVRLRMAPGLYYDRPGEFDYVAPMVDSQTDTIKFKARFANPGRRLRPGQIVTAVVERKKPVRSLIIPKEAVLTDPDGNYIFVPKEIPADPNAPVPAPALVADTRRVTVADKGLDKEYVVTAGLAEGDKFILKGLMSMGATLRPGSPIRLAEQPSGQPPAGVGSAPAPDAAEEAPAGDGGAK